MGLITDYDIRRYIEKEENIFSKTIGEIMNPHPLYVNDKEKTFTALKLMQEREAGQCCAGG